MTNHDMRGFEKSAIGCVVMSGLVFLVLLCGTVFLIVMESMR